MAVDTRDKRMSFIAFGKPVPQVFPNPDGTVNDGDRPQWMYLYAGISIIQGQPTMRRWGGIPHVRQTGPFGRSW